MYQLTRIAALAALLSCCSIAAAHEGEEKGKLGTVKFANSCAPAVQQELQRGVAMLHSFWYSEGEKTFRNVLAKDPGCAIATWGVASILMSNPLGGLGASPKGAAAAQAAIEQGRKAGAKDRKSTRLNSSHTDISRMPSSA